MCVWKPNLSLKHALLESLADSMSRTLLSMDYNMAFLPSAETWTQIKKKHICKSLAA